MKAYIIRKAGGPEKLVQEELPMPKISKGKVLIKIKAFGLNRSEYFTRIGKSPTVEFPRVLGIECVGEVIESLDDNLRQGQRVFAMMGGMGREFNGSYAEYTLVPIENTFKVESTLPWEVLGALPEMLQTTHGSLFQSLEIERAKTILIRGGTSSIGLCALAISKNHGLEVISTSRSPEKAQMLRDLGAAEVIIDSGEISSRVRELYPRGIDRVLDLIGTTSLLDSLQTLKRGGIACMAGILGGSWQLNEFKPMVDIPTAVKLTSYSGEATDISSEQLHKYLGLIETGDLKIQLGKVFKFADLQQAHHLMDANNSNGKIVVAL